jgi:hypothetical protein
MGTDCAPFLANLFLYAYEFEWLGRMSTSKFYHVAHKFNKCFRYIDDLLCFNNDGLMQKYMYDIYPEELVLKLANLIDCESPFLDLFLEVKENTIQCKLYDKRDDFTFDIVNFPFLCGNVPTNQSYGTFTAQIIRYGRGCMNSIDFIFRCQNLSCRLLKQGFRRNKLVSTFRKCQLGKHNYLLTRYVMSPEDLLNACIHC